jgi:FAD/FMN-containing dehydrogenase
MNDCPSWGLQPPSHPAAVRPIHWRDEAAGLAADGDLPRLAYGRGRSYGDVCLNNGGLIIPTNALNGILAFDRERGELTAETGVTFGEMLRFILPAGWCLPVVPGTQHLTLGGAIANDVHGKDHPIKGAFGRHIVELELWRSREGRLICGPEQNAEYFRATVGGLGLTGLITRATFRLLRVPGSCIEAETYKDADCLRDMLRPDGKYPYAVAWLDGSASGKDIGRGIITRGRFAPGEQAVQRRVISIPPVVPSGLLNRTSLTLLNRTRWLRGPRGLRQERLSWEGFFHPLDQIGNWNHLFGKRGFYQHQSVIPRVAGREPVRELMRAVRAGGASSFVTVLKTLGPMESPGMLSFPKEGLSLALDLPNNGQSTLDLLERLDEITVAAGGRIYPAKDARMSAATFRAGYPQWETFSRFADPAFSSSFWRRVTGK